MPFFLALIPAFNSVLSFLLRGVVLKFVLMFVLFYGVSEMLPALIGLLPGVGGIKALFIALPDGMWWWIKILQVEFGVGVLLSAIATRFIIRRLPVIG